MIPFEAIPAYLLTGACAGFFAGLLGVGGGVVVVPVLTMIFAWLGFPGREVLHLALGTSIATILFTSLSSLRAHHAHRAVLWPVMRALTPGILIGTSLGAGLAVAISSRALSIFFVGFMLFVALQMIANLRPQPSRNLPGRAGLGLAGIVIGAVASLAAMGGGALTVPYLIRCNVNPHQAIGTSAAVGLPIALGGTLGYIWNGWAHPGLPPGSLGFVYLPALGIILLASVLAAPLGARLAHRLPVIVLKRIFAGLLLILSAKMLWSLYGS
uniref:Probable membrane transporter protein n=1 Tax=Dechloromonas aromatica (strain RCB) TaxID=159087 RepID=Q478J1_DECAR